MALNTPENITRLLQKLIEAINAGRDIGSLVAEVGLDNDDAQLVIKTLKKRIRNVRTISKLSKEINELELNIQGTSTSEQNRIARDLASRRASSNKRKMSFYENLGGLGYKLDARGNLIEASRYDYLRQKYYNRYAEFGDDGEVENQSEASRIASILARRQVRNEREEEERKRQEKENAEKTSRQEANIAARGRYRDAMRDIRDQSHMEKRRLYESFLEVDESTGKSSLDQRKAAAKKAREVSASEKANADTQSNLSARQSYSDFMRSHIDPRRYRLAQLAHSFYEEPIPTTLQERADFKAGKWDYEEKRKEARKAAMDKAKKALAAENQNTKSVNENTKALTGLRAFIGPYAKLAMPFYAAKAIYNATESDTTAAIERVNRRTFGGLYGASKDRKGYKNLFNLMTSYGASEKDVMREYAGQKKWASTLMFGMGMDKIEALAMILGKAPGPAEMKDPERMQEWLKANIRGATDLQAIQLSAMGVASDTFIESARKGQAGDLDARASNIRRTYKSLYEQTGLIENPFRVIQYGIGRDNARAIAEGGLTGKIYTGEMLGAYMLAGLWDFAKNIFSDDKGRTLSEQMEIIPSQNNITVNINGNIDSEERAHSFAEQIGAEVSNAEK